MKQVSHDKTCVLHFLLKILTRDVTDKLYIC